jgi:hypothetical protein
MVNPLLRLDCNVGIPFAIQDDNLSAKACYVRLVPYHQRCHSTAHEQWMASTLIGKIAETTRINRYGGRGRLQM